jgi:hypothetical protein
MCVVKLRDQVFLGVVCACAMQLGLAAVSAFDAVEDFG